MNRTPWTTTAELPAGVVVPRGLTEEQGLVILAALAGRFGWTYALWGRKAVEDALDNLHLATAPRGGLQCRRLTDQEWDRVVQSRAWREVIPGYVLGQVAEQDLLEDAAIAAGLACVECGSALDAPPGSTGRLCEEHRTGPAGQPAVADPVTEGLYWLYGGTLVYAPVEWERRLPMPQAAQPVVWEVLEPAARRRAQRARAALRAAPSATPNGPGTNPPTCP
jgi:hypothetical protein